MYRSRPWQARLPRILSVALVVAAYTATLVWASEITAHGATAPVRDAVVMAGGAATTQLDADTTAAAATLAEAPREAPLMTLAIAAFALVTAGGWYGTRRLGPRPVRRRTLLVRHARLAGRHFTTLL